MMSIALMDYVYNVQPIRVKTARKSKPMPCRDPVVHEASQTTNQKSKVHCIPRLQLLTRVLAGLARLLGQEVWRVNVRW